MANRRNRVFRDEDGRSGWANSGSYRPCDRATTAGWKTFPVRIPGPGRSPCHDAQTVLVESMGGGFVTSNCGWCGTPRTLGREEFGGLRLPVNCPECRGPMRPHVPGQTPEVWLPTANYAFRCDACRAFIELHWLLPKWSDLFTRQGDGAGFPDWAGGGHGEPSNRLDFVHCPRCVQVTACAAVETGPLPAPPGNYYSNESPDLQWLRRLRECQECGERFFTAELAERFVYELERIRSLSARLASHSGACSAVAGQLVLLAEFLRELSMVGRTLPDE